MRGKSAFHERGDACEWDDIVISFHMADILIRRVSETTKEMLRKRAERRGKSLEADLREALERLAREEPDAPDDAVPFGDWLVSITRPGIELAETLEQLRAAPPRLPALE